MLDTECKTRTKPVAKEPDLGHAWNTISTQRSGENASEVQLIVDAWPQLPDSVRRGIVAMIRALAE